MTWLDDNKWNSEGLVPLIAQEAETGKILMFARMNRESLKRTVLSGGGGVFVSPRMRLWHKGEESGPIQRVRNIRSDCDGDAVLLHLERVGDIACHTVRCSYFQKLDDNKWEIDEPTIKDPAEIYSK